jgi:hypothetical protein
MLKISSLMFLALAPSWGGIIGQLPNQFAQVDLIVPDGHGAGVGFMQRQSGATTTLAFVATGGTGSDIFRFHLQLNATPWLGPYGSEYMDDSATADVLDNGVSIAYIQTPSSGIWQGDTPFGGLVFVPFVYGVPRAVTIVTQAYADYAFSPVSLPQQMIGLDIAAGVSIDSVNIPLGATITILDALPTPEPEALYLVGVGLLMLGARLISTLPRP